MGGWSVWGLQGNLQLCSLRVGKYRVIAEQIWELVLVDL